MERRTAGVNAGARAARGLGVVAPEMRGAIGEVIFMAIRIGAVDVRVLPHGEKHGRVLREFDGLEPGKAFVLVSDHEPRGLLAELQATRSRQFEWNVVETGPEVYRIEIERRTSSSSRDVSEYLGRDHDRLDAILEDALRRAAGGDVAGARASFGEFASGLVHHIKAEENVLFPAFEQLTGMRGGPVVVMHHEHRMIGRLLETGKAALAADDPKAFASAVAELVSVLGPHNAKEEGVLYPMTDGSLAGERDRDDLVRALQAQSSQDSCGCCSHAQAPGRRLGVVS
jgi:uncharacterized protein (DUF2249 family)